MQFTNQYKPFIEKEERIAKNNIKPLEIYRISTYKYADGDIKSLAGINSALVFSIGIYEKKFNCIKLSEIRPDMFFKFMAKLKNKSLTEQKIDEAEFLYDLMISTKHLLMLFMSDLLCGLHMLGKGGKTAPKI